MAKFLHLDASPRGGRSVSRQLAVEFMQQWAPAHPGHEVVYRDLGREPVPHVTEAWVEGAYSPPESQSEAAVQAMTVSNQLVDELKAAQRLLISTPMYNLNVPSTLKAWIDQIVRVNRTFTMDMQGLVKNTKALVITSRGGSYGPGTPFAAYDLQEPYLRAILGFIGITDVTFVHAEGINQGDEARETGVAGAQEELKRLAAAW